MANSDQSDIKTFNYSKCARGMLILFPSVLWHCWLGDRKGIWPVKTRCWFVGGDHLTGALHLIVSVITTPSIILSSNKIQNGDILTQVHLEEWLLKWRQRKWETKTDAHSLFIYAD